MLALGVAYLEAVVAAGGIPMILAPLPGHSTDALADRLDGLCLSGGPDMHPASYGGMDHPELGPTESEVDAFELDLARAAKRRGLPLLAICRGLQVLNVARGGTLLQHLPDDVGKRVSPRQPEPASEPTHCIAVEPASRLARLMGEREPRVNSFHHQAIAALGRGLRPVAWSEDGVVEAVEAPGEPFTVGVQWHAECLRHRPEQAALFGGLVDAAGLRSQLGAEAAA
jgi:putative glutamine amidotransferase